MLKTTILFSALFGCAFGGRVAGRGEVEACPPFFEKVGEQCYFFSAITGLSKSWYDARQYCHSLSTDFDIELAVLDLSCTDNEALLKYMADNDWPSMWLGGSDIGMEGQWHWLDERPVDFSAHYWYPDEPSTGHGYNCALAVRYGTEHPKLYLTDNDCDSTFFFACQAGIIVVE